MEQQINMAAERAFSETAERPLPAPAEVEAPELDAAAFGAEHALKALVEYQMEGLRFVARRTQANLEFMRHLPHCKGWEEVAKLQQGWVKDCVADYGEEVGRFAGTGLQLMMSDLVPLQPLLYRKPARERHGNGRSA